MWPNHKFLHKYLHHNMAKLHDLVFLYVLVDNFSFVFIRYITVQAAKGKNSGVKMLASQGTGGTGESKYQFNDSWYV